MTKSHRGKYRGQRMNLRDALTPAFGRRLRRTLLTAQRAGGVVLTLALLCALLLADLSVTV